jgi:hypothetical protein
VFSIFENVNSILVVLITITFCILNEVASSLVQIFDVIKEISSENSHSFTNSSTAVTLKKYSVSG